MRRPPDVHGAPAVGPSAEATAPVFGSGGGAEAAGRTRHPGGRAVDGRQGLFEAGRPTLDVARASARVCMYVRKANHLPTIFIDSPPEIGRRNHEACEIYGTADAVSLIGITGNRTDARGTRDSPGWTSPLAAADERPFLFWRNGRSRTSIFGRPRRRNSNTLPTLGTRGDRSLGRGGTSLRFGGTGGVERQFWASETAELKYTET